MRSQPLRLMMILALAAAPLAAQHNSGGSPSGGHSRSSHACGYSTHPRTHSTHPRPERQHRSEAAKDEFMRQARHAHDWPGHVVDHIVPLACGEADEPSNMQWQTVQEAKEKDKWERKGCSSPRRK